MNAYIHSKISMNKRGGTVDDYYPIHSFMDCTKELCSDNRHRILHNHWGIRRVIIPIFGHTIINSDNQEVNVKDLLEQDHILPDYNNNFIPVLSDFTNEMEELTNDEITLVNKLYEDIQTKKAKEILLSPLDLTGDMKSLRVTFNSWFIRSILPRISEEEVRIENLNGLEIFENMQFRNSAGPEPDTASIRIAPPSSPLALFESNVDSVMVRLPSNMPPIARPPTRLAKLQESICRSAPLNSNPPYLPCDHSTFGYCSGSLNLRLWWVFIF